MSILSVVLSGYSTIILSASSPSPSLINVPFGRLPFSGSSFSLIGFFSCIFSRTDFFSSGVIEPVSATTTLSLSSVSSTGVYLSAILDVRSPIAFSILSKASLTSLGLGFSSVSALSSTSFALVIASSYAFCFSESAPV